MSNPWSQSYEDLRKSIDEKADKSYLETDMKKRAKNNEKARKEMEKIPGQKNPHFEALDPVGQEDKDIDNDGDHDKSDKYLARRRKAIGKAMKTQKEDWRSSLGFIDEAGCASTDDQEDKKDMKSIGKGKVKNKIEVMPNVKMGKQNEEVEVEEGYGAPGHNPGSGEKSVERTKAFMKKKGMKGAPGLDAMAARKAEHEAKRGVKKEENEVEELDEKCWDSHKQVGMKKKGGKMVPNCVPKNEEAEVEQESYGSALQVQQPEKNPPKRQQKMSQAASQYAKSKKKPGFKDFPTEELDYYLKGDFNPAAHAANAVKKMAAEASWDMKTGKSKDPKKRAEAQRVAADMRARDRRAGRRTYGSAKLGYAKKDWDE